MDHNATLVPNTEFSQFEVNNWILSNHVVNHLIPIVGIHPFPVNELLLMSGTLCRQKPTHLFEWGTHVGKSARIFYETKKKFDLKFDIHTTDLPSSEAHPEHPGSRRGALIKGIEDIHQHLGDGLSVSMEIASSLKLTSRFLFFLDGDHRYEQVLRELSTVMNEFPSASILVHDTFYQDEESQYNTGPYDAVQKVITQYDGYGTVSTKTGLPGMTLIYPV